MKHSSKNDPSNLKKVLHLSNLKIEFIFYWTGIHINYFWSLHNKRVFHDQGNPQNKNIAVSKKNKTKVFEELLFVSSKYEHIKNRQSQF